MGWLATSAAVAVVLGSAVPLSAEESGAGQPRPSRTPSVPVVAVAPLSLDQDDPQIAARRLEEALIDRLKPIEQRLRHDTRLRRAGTVVGLGAMALGALRGDQSLAFVGTGALRLGFDRQLTTVQRKTGFSVAPTITRRGCAVTVTRTLH